MRDDDGTSIETSAVTFGMAPSSWRVSCLSWTPSWSPNRLRSPARKTLKSTALRLGGGETAPSPGSAGYSPGLAGERRPLPRLRRVLPRLGGGEYAVELGVDP